LWTDGPHFDCIRDLRTLPGINHEVNIMAYENANQDLRAINSLLVSGAITREEAQELCNFVEGLA